MTRAAQIEPWLTPSDVAKALSCGTTTAKHKMKHVLGGWYEPNAGWRCTAKALRAYRERQERQGATCQVVYPSSSDAPRAELTGTATSEPLTVADSSEPYTSEQTEAESPSAQPQPHTGKSKHGLRLEKILARNRRPSAKLSKLSTESSSSPK